MRRLLVLIAVGLLAGVSLAPAEDEAAAPPGSITFVGKNAVATANGIFHAWKVTDSRVDFDDLPGSFVEIEVDVASLDTDVVRRDDHLRSADFFEVERWPTATVRVHGVRPSGEDEQGRSRYEAQFELRIRDVTKTVPGSFSVTSGDPVEVEGALSIDRNDWGIGEPKKRWNPMSIGNDIPIAFRASLPKPAAPAAD
jgi:polyisoprenoid-binding protein YceI